MVTTIRATSAAVRRALEDRGVNQEAVAAMLGLKQASVSDRYRGRTPWRLNELEELARLLGTPVHELLQPRADQPEAANA